MEFEDYLQPEVGIAAVVTATLFSPRARRFLRKGLVYGTAGVLIAGDAMSSFTRSIGQGAQRAREEGPRGEENQMVPAGEEAGGLG
jgi:hypothetical protein